MKRVTLQFANDFHDTEISLRAIVVDGVAMLTRRQHIKAHNELCGSDDCTCGMVRGDQPDWPDEVRDYRWLDRWESAGLAERLRAAKVAA